MAIKLRFFVGNKEYGGFNKFFRCTFTYLDTEISLNETFLRKICLPLILELFI